MHSTIGALAGGLFLLAAPASAQAPDWMERIDSEELATGELHLGLFVDGEQDGFMRFGWHADGEVVRIWDRTMWASREVYETFEGSVRTEDLSPLAVDISFHSGSAYMVYDNDFEPGRVTGAQRLHRPGQPVASRPVDQALESGTLMRATTFVIAGLLELEPGEAVSFNWYAPMSGAVEAVTLSAIETVAIETPAGAFDTVRIEQRGGSPANDIFVDTATGAIVRIDVDGQPMQFLALPAAE